MAIVKNFAQYLGCEIWEREELTQNSSHPGMWKTIGKGRRLTQTFRQVILVFGKGVKELGMGGTDTNNYGSHPGTGCPKKITQ